jgi:PKD domain-containing protein
MRERIWTRVSAALVALLMAAVVHAQCVQTSKPISLPAVFPSLVAGPIASTGSTLGLAKSDTSTSSPAIFFAIFDSNLNQITLDRQVAATSLNGPSALFWTGTEFGLFYLRPDYTLVLQRVDGSGNPIGTPTPMPHSWSSNDEFDMAWSPALNAYTVAHFVTLGFDLGLWLSVVTPTSAVVSDLNLSVFAGSPANPRVAPLPDGTVAVLWSRPTITPPITFMGLVNPTTRTFKIVAITNRAISNPRIATNGSSILMVFTSPLTSGGTELRYALVDTLGTVLKADSSLMTGSGIDIAPLSLIWTPTLSEWALVYSDANVGFGVFPGETRLRRFASPTGTFSDTQLSPDPLHNRMNAPFPIVFINNGYVGSIQRVISSTAGSESYLVKLCPFFVTATANPPVAHQFIPVTFSASASGGTPGFSFSWQFGDNDSAQGTVVQHFYQLPGTYTVTLTGTDAAGATSITRINVVITTGGRLRSARH